MGNVRSVYFFCLTSNQKTIIMKLNTISPLIEAAKLAVEVPAKQPTLLAKLQAHGLDPAAQKQGQQLLQQFIQQQANHQRLKEDQWSVTQQIKEALVAVQSQFRAHVRVAKVAFREDKALLHALRIERISTRRWECVKQADHFYSLLRQRQVSLKAYDISDKEIEQSQASVTQLLQLKQDRTALKGQVEQETLDKRNTQHALQAWVAEFRLIARVAFRHQPQWLEAFGVAVATPA